jgi:DNA-binding response OmpR family regulator
VKSEPLVVLLVEDDPGAASMTSRILQAHGMDVRWTETSLGASNLARRIRPNLILLDVELPALSGDALVALLRRAAPEGMRIVLYSSHDDAHLRAIARRTGADGWISKGADGEVLAQYLTRVARLGGHEA